MKRICILFLALSALATTARAQVEITGVEVGNVSTTSFSVLWTTSEMADPALGVFADAEGNTSLEGQVGVEFFPLQQHRVDVGSTFDQRAARRELQNLSRDKNVVLVRVTGATPGVTYYLRPRAVDGGGNDLTAAPESLVEVTTADTAAFITEARQVVVDFSALLAGGGDINGGVAILGNGVSPYPLFSVIGDSSLSNKAYFDITHFLDAAGETTWKPDGEVQASLRWVGIAPANGSYTGVPPTYSGETTVASSSTLTFQLEDDLEGSFEIQIADVPPVQGLPLPITIVAVDDQGDPLTDFIGTATITSDGTISSGGGATAQFANGQLSDHVLLFGAPGLVTLSVTDFSGSITGTAQIDVQAKTLATWRDYYYGGDAAGDPTADPDNDGVVNLLEYALNRDPSVPSDYDPLPILINDDDHLSLTFHRIADPSLVYVVEGSDDLFVWEDIWTSTGVDNVEGEVTVEDPETASVEAARFLRLTVSVNE